MDKHWWASKSILIQLVGLVGMVLIGLGVVGETQWALYCGVITQVLGVVIRIVTKGAVTW